MSDYDEKAKIREAMAGFPANLAAKLTGTFSRGGLSKSDSAAADVDKHVPVTATGAQEEASSIVNLGRDGPEHDFKAAVSAFPHDDAPDTEQDSSGDGRAG